MTVDRYVETCLSKTPAAENSGESRISLAVNHELGRRSNGDRQSRILKRPAAAVRFRPWPRFFSMTHQARR